MPSKQPGFFERLGFSSDSSDVEFQDIGLIRSRLLNTLINFFAVMALPNVTFGVIDGIKHQQLKRAGVYAFIYLALLALTIFKKRIPFELRAKLGLGLVFASGVGIWMSYGLTGAGGLVFVVYCLGITLFFGKRPGLTAVWMCLAVIVVSGAAANAGLLKPSVAPIANSGSVLSWLIAVSLMAVLCLGIVLTPSILFEHLESALRVQKRQADVLREANEQLLKEIQERQKAENQTLTLQKQLLHAQKLETIGTLAGGIAHDFNNILQGMLWSIELVSSEVDGESLAGEGILRIRKGAERAGKLVQQILTFSRQIEPEIRPINLPEIVDEVVDFVSSSMPSNVNIIKKIDSTCPVLLADGNQIFQVIVNLVTNSMHALEKNGGTISVVADAIGPMNLDNSDSHQKEPTLCLRIRVIDDGPGIDASLIDRVFEPFFTTKDVGKGTGLGLSVAHGIVRKHGGKISVESRQGISTCFEVILPCRKLKEVVDNANANNRQGQGEQVLFVEDNEDIAWIAEQLLKGWGYNVTSACSGDEALKIFMKQPGFFDLVITDRAMPGISGTQLAEKISEIRADLPIILISGYAEIQVSSGIRPAGVTDFLMKPIAPLEFQTTILRALKNAKDQALRKDLNPAE